MDVCVGIGLALAVPLLVVLFLDMTGLTKTKPDLRTFRESVFKDGQIPPPDVEEVNLKLDFARRMYNQNAREFVQRFQNAKGNQRVNERRWAGICLSRVKAELTNLKRLIYADPAGGSRFADQLREVGALEGQVASDEKLLREFDY